MLVWNPKIFLRDKFFPVQAVMKLEARPASRDLWAGHSPCECHPGLSDQMAMPYLPAQGRVSSARRISHGICGKGTDKLVPHHHPAWWGTSGRCLTGNYVFLGFLSPKTSSFKTRIVLFFFFFLVSRSPEAYHRSCCHPLTTAVNWPLITLITSPYSPCPVLSYTLD